MDHQGYRQNKAGGNYLSGRVENFFYIPVSGYLFFSFCLFRNTDLSNKKTTTPFEFLPFKQKRDSSC
jgi:hypothetical protein